MKKFILIVPCCDNEKFYINKNYINNIKYFNIPYFICDYNIKNINLNYVGGILLTGGGDINPKIYNKPNKKSKSIYTSRDVFEINLLKQAFKRKIPTLGICRGMQIMNVAFGGDIKQHIPNHMQKKPKNKQTHYININKNSGLFNIIKKDKIKVNSFHHQVIFKPAKNFNICATCKNVVEGIEYINKDMFFLGLQWHPEGLYDIYSKKIFKSFVQKINKGDKNG